MVRFGLFGTVEVWDDSGHLVPLPSAKHRLLLAVLLVETNRVVAGDRLADELWGEALPDDPPAALRNSIARLRRALGSMATRLVTEDRGYRLRAERKEIDTGRFEELLAQSAATEGEPALALLDQALALRRGPALVEFADRSFAQPEAVRLEELYRVARERQAELSLAMGDVQAAVVTLEGLAAAEPDRERVQGLLMEALYRAGRHVDALATYESWRRRQADNYGLEPSPELKRLERQILQHTVPGRAQDQSDVRTGVAPPAAPSSFVGREGDGAAVIELLGRARLVTLVGPGGVGKTRLALEVAHAIDSRRGGVRFCDLSGVRRPIGLVRGLATAVGVDERAFRRLEDQLVEHLASLSALLIVDNCEHLIDAVASLAGRLLRETRRVSILATSRERLSVPGEHVWPVEPLPASGPDAPAVHLFRDRAAAVDPTLKAHDLDSAGVQALCARLDGLPLAIELAAARAPGMTIAELTASLASPGPVLAGGRGVAERHSSLSAVVDWSFRLLDPADQRVFARLSVFAGDFDVGAATAVIGADAGGDHDRTAARTALVRLADRSMIVAARDGATTRYRLLDTLRRYGAERLDEWDEADAVGDRHADWVLDLTGRAAAGVGGANEGAWADRLDRAFADLRAAHGWLVGRDPARSLRLVCDLHWYALWRMRSEVFRWAEVAAAAAAEWRSPLLAAAFASAAFGAAYRGDLEAGAQAAQAASRTAQANGGHLGTHRALESLGEVALLRGELDRAVDLYRRAGEQATGADDHMAAAWDTASVSLALAWSGRHDEADGFAVQARSAAEDSGSASARAFVHYAFGEILAAREPEAAERHLRWALSLAEPVGARLVVAIAGVTLATLYSRHHHDAPSALRYYQELIDEWHRAGLWTSQWVTLRTLVELLTRIGQVEDAAALYGAVASAVTGAPAYGTDLRRLNDAATQLRSALGDDAFATAVARGEHVDEDGVVALAHDAIRRALLAQTLV